MKGWIAIKNMYINLDTVSAVQLSDDNIKIFAHGLPLVQFGKGLGGHVETLGSDEFNRVIKELKERLECTEAVT